MPVYDTGGRIHASPSYSYGNSINYGLSNKEREEEEKKEQQRIERETRTATLQIPSSKKPNASDEELWKEFRRTIYRKYGKDVALSMPSSGAFFRLGEQINSTIPLKSAISIYKDWEHLWKMTVEEIKWRERVRPEFYHTQDYSEIEGEESAEPEPEPLTLEPVESQWKRGELHLSAAPREFLSIKGEQLYQQGDYHNAYDFFLELFHREPDNHLALFYLGVSAVYTEQYEKAVVINQKAIDEGNRTAQASYFQGVAYEKLGQKEKAILAYQAASTEMPDAMKAFIRLKEEKLFNRFSSSTPLTEDKGITRKAEKNQKRGSNPSTSVSKTREDTTFNQSGKPSRAVETNIPQTANKLNSFDKTKATEPLDVAELTPVEKLTEAVIRASLALPGEVGERIRAILTPGYLASTVAVLGIYAASHAIGVGQIADVGMLIIGGVYLGKNVFSVVNDLIGFAGAINATTEKELDEAGQHLASAISTVGVNTVVALLTKKAATKIKDGVNNSRVNNPNRLPGNNGGAVTRVGRGQIEPRGSNSNTTSLPVVAPQLPSTSETETVENERTGSSSEIVGVDETVLANLEQQYPNNLFASDGNLVEINNQIDIHPLKIAETDTDTMNAIVSSTKELNEVGGDITKVAPQTRRTIEDLTKTAGGRWRFEYQKNGVVNQYLEYVGLEDNELFQNMSDTEKTRLFDVPNQMQYLDEVPENARKRARKLEAKAQERTIEQQAASYAIQQNPKNANEFVNYTEFYKTQIEQEIGRVGKLYLNKRDQFYQELSDKGIDIEDINQKQIIEINRQASQELFQELYEEAVQLDGEKQVKKYIKEKVYESSGTIDNIGQVNQQTSNKIQNSYQEKVAEISDNIGGVQIETNLSSEQTIEQIKAIADKLKFGDESAAAYHAEKHYEELPLSHQEGNNLFNDYWQSAIKTIKYSKEVVSSYSQNGNRSFIFKYTYSEENLYSLQAIVAVSQKGIVNILTYFKQ